MKHWIWACMLGAVGCGMIACSSPGRVALPAQQTQRRAIEALPPDIYADTVTVQDFRRVCDALARDLITQPFITRSGKPPVITIRKLANKTSLMIDEQIFQETIRVQLMEHARGAVLFRDDQSYRDIVQERLRQSSNEIEVTLTDSVVSKSTNQRGRDLEFDRGSLSGQGQHASDSALQDAEQELELEQSASVSGKVAQADYFLRGLIYQLREPDAQSPDGGMSYFQYQFRVVDARSGIIMWEKMLDTKLARTYAPVKAAPAGSGGQAGGAPNLFNGCVLAQGSAAQGSSAQGSAAQGSNTQGSAAAAGSCPPGFVPGNTTPQSTQSTP
ncbi:MAG: hypothetical protein GY946_26015 [bacterium]|nr:hypothetical protein [bacterium]